MSRRRSLIARPRPPAKPNGKIPDKNLGKADDAPRFVTASALGPHIGCSRQNVVKLADEGVIERRADGLFDQDQSRLRYIRFLQSARRNSARSEADAALARSKARLMELRIGQQERTLMRVDEALEVVDAITGLYLTKLSELPARATRDLSVRRSIDKVVREIRDELASECAKRVAEIT
jgi:hypothetical protein